MMTFAAFILSGLFVTLKYCIRKKCKYDFFGNKGVEQLDREYDKIKDKWERGNRLPSRPLTRISDPYYYEDDILDYS